MRFNERLARLRQQMGLTTHWSTCLAGDLGERPQGSRNASH
jgi:hypothetical protein